MEKNHSLMVPFSPQQIVCLASGDRRLYGAVIQYIPAQNNYWLRPLCLVGIVGTTERPISLHRTADLIIAAHRLREALDTEILNFWSALYDDSGEYHDNVAGRQILNRFLRDLDWN